MGRSIICADMDMEDLKELLFTRDPGFELERTIAWDVVQEMMDESGLTDPMELAEDLCRLQGDIWPGVDNELGLYRAGIMDMDSGIVCLVPCDLDRLLAIWIGSWIKSGNAEKVALARLITKTR